MAKYDIKCSSCGKEYTVNLTGPGWQRKSYITYLESYGECPECKQKRREEEASEQAASDKEKGFPELRGSEKQVMWALSLRKEFINECERQELKEEYRYIYDYILQNVVQAKVWIDSRDDLLELFVKYKEDADNAKQQTQRTDKVIDSIKQEAEMTVTPEEVKHSGAVTVTATDKEVHVKYKYDPEFIEIVKDRHLKYSDGVWTRKCNKFTGSTIDRAAEITNTLLSAGFKVKVNDDAIKEAAIAADFEPECRKWVLLRTSGNYAGYLAISFDSDNELYNQAHTLPKSRWNNGKMVVPVDCYKEVLDFADMLGFKVSDGAMQAIENYKASLTPPVSVNKPEKPEEQDKLSEILQSSADVLPDLKDE